MADTPHERALAVALDHSDTQGMALPPYQIRSLIAAYLASMKEQGWKMVPYKPTEAMERAASGERSHVVANWFCMWDAAPEADHG